MNPDALNVIRARLTDCIGGLALIEHTDPSSSEAITPDVLQGVAGMVRRSLEQIEGELERLALQ